MVLSSLTIFSEIVGEITTGCWKGDSRMGSRRVVIQLRNRRFHRVSRSLRRSSGRVGGIRRRERSYARLNGESAVFRERSEAGVSSEWSLHLNCETAPVSVAVWSRRPFARATRECYNPSIEPTLIAIQVAAHRFPTKRHMNPPQPFVLQ